MLLGEGLAANLGVKVGDTIVLVVTTAQGSINGVDARVRGIFATITKAYDDNALRVPLPMAQQLVRVAGATSWVVLLDETGRTDEIAKTLQAQFNPGSSTW